MTHDEFVRDFPNDSAMSDLLDNDVGDAEE
jgi:hypothetical protein